MLKARSLGLSADVFLMQLQQPFLCAVVGRLLRQAVLLILALEGGGVWGLTLNKELSGD
jgi:hypothetical protein